MKTMTQTTRDEYPATATAQADRVQFDVPAINIRETKDGYELQAEMPGVTKAGLDVTVENNELVIVGKRSDEPLPGELLHRESRRNDFRRAFEFDPSVDTTRIQAKIDQGVLTLTLPKAEAVKPRRIEVTE